MPAHHPLCMKLLRLCRSQVCRRRSNTPNGAMLYDESPAAAASVPLAAESKNAQLAGGKLKGQHVPHAHIKPAPFGAVKKGSDNV